MSTEFYLIAVALVTVLSASRLTRLAVHDDFPPVRFFRDKMYDLLDGGVRRRQWQIITWCGYCASFWLTMAVVAWADLSGIFDGYQVVEGQDLSLWQQAWWFVNGTLAASYAAAILMANDGDNGDEN
ncbi:hypothetical protein [Aeromicrobium sp.]|uniref:hypothetical protein n=1 Tax=Aeromicrobium sp. TaxID=1871063 RepID=UPI0019B00F90|nr:hypothetical protein [Aeromicrobium sp.]MBC7630316.1 hypothetical protein [Aeromicrobium sp.]